MHVVKGYPDGVFSWIDLAMTDVAGAKAFYSGLFGWEAVDLETDMGSFYTMFRLQGYNVAGAGPMDPNMSAQGIPPFWSSYVKHSDVDAVAARAAEAGGNVLFPPMDVMEEGRMTMIQDPTGAMVGVWQPRNLIGAQLVNMPNTLVWNELQTRDGEGAKAFYRSVFDWEYDADENNYITCKQEDRVQAGMMEMDEHWDPNTPANWAVYILVEDVDTTVANVGELGGRALVPPTRAGEVGTFSVIQDPQGAVLTVMQSDGPVDTPPGV